MIYFTQIPNASNQAIWQAGNMSGDTDNNENGNAD